jgi:hypothetical protein
VCRQIDVDVWLKLNVERAISGTGRSAHRSVKCVFVRRGCKPNQTPRRADQVLQLRARAGIEEGVLSDFNRRRVTSSRSSGNLDRYSGLDRP